MITHFQNQKLQQLRVSIVAVVVVTMLAVGAGAIHMEGWDVMRVVDQSVGFVVRVFILTVQPQQQPLRRQQRVFYLAHNV